MRIRKLKTSQKAKRISGERQVPRMLWRLANGVGAYRRRHKHLPINALANAVARETMENRGVKGDSGDKYAPGFSAELAQMRRAASDQTPLVHRINNEGHARGGTPRSASH